MTAKEIDGRKRLVARVPTQLYNDLRETAFKLEMSQAQLVALLLRHGLTEVYKVETRDERKERDAGEGAGERGEGAGERGKGVAM